MKDLRYLVLQDKFVEYAYLALKGRFVSKNDFTAFFNAIINNDQKNLFLKTATFYLFLVKQGDWFVDVPGSNKRVDYLTDTYKYIAIFSLIESLRKHNFMDFFAYLIKKNQMLNFQFMIRPN